MSFHSMTTHSCAEAATSPGASSLADSSKAKGHVRVSVVPAASRISSEEHIAPLKSAVRPTSVSTAKPRPLSTASVHSPRSPPTSPLLSDGLEKAFETPFSRAASRRQKRESAFYGDINEKEEKKVMESSQARPLSMFVDEWPEEPQKLCASAWYDIIVDVVLTAIPLLCFVYAICAGVLQNRPTASNYHLDGQWSWSAYLLGPAMMRAQKWAATAFPYIFSLEMARAVKAFALWRAEQGTRLGFLEQLVGSTSLGGTISSLWGMRIFLNGAGITLLCLWGLAPLGSQAGQRLLSTNGTSYYPDHLSYMNTNATPNGLEDPNAGTESYQYAVNGLLATTILTPAAMQSAQDPWANVKIPSIEWLEKHQGCRDDGWCSLDYANKNSVLGEVAISAGTFSSLSGMPVVGGAYGLGVQQFNLESSYYSIHCSSLDLIDPSAQLRSSLPNRSQPYTTDSDSAIWNADGHGPYTFFLDTDTPVANVGDVQGDARNGSDFSPSNYISPRSLYFGTRTPRGPALANCTTKLTHVESSVTCNFSQPLWNRDLTAHSGRTAQGACRVERVRKSLKDLRPEGFTDLDKSYLIPQRFFTAAPGVTGPAPHGASSAIEHFLVNLRSNSASSSTNKPLVAANWLGFDDDSAASTATNSSSASKLSPRYVDLTTMSLSDFTERFQLFFNTYWHAYCNLQAMTQTELGLGYGHGFPKDQVMFIRTDVFTTLPGQYYLVNFAWLAVFVLCSVVALVMGLLAMYLKYHTLVPDVLGKVSVMARNNPDIPVPEGGSTLDGAEFARRVMWMPVKFVDKSPRDEVGRVGMVSLEHHQQTTPASATAGTPGTGNVGLGIDSEKVGEAVHHPWGELRKGRLYK